MNNSNTSSRIFIQDWLELKPYEQQVPSDTFYLQLSNKVKKAILSNRQSLQFDIIEGVNPLSCLLAAYLEDLVSKTNIWNTFVNCHKELYGKPLPFFDTPDYYHGEVNIEDIQFLIWYFLGLGGKELDYSPLDKMIRLTAATILPVLDEAWEHAPENTELAQHYTLAKDASFYDVRQMMSDVLYNSYLFQFDTGEKLEMGMKETIGSLDQERMAQLDRSRLLAHLKLLMIDIELDGFEDLRTRLLAFNAQDWVANMLDKRHPLYRSVKNMSPRITGEFLCLGTNERGHLLEHIPSRLKFEVCLESNTENELRPVANAYYGASIVKWQDRWWFSGGLYPINCNEEYIEKERKSTQNLKAVWFVNRNEKWEKEYLQKRFHAFMDFSNGRQHLLIKANSGSRILEDFKHYFDYSVLSPLPEKHRTSISFDPAVAGEESDLLFFNPAYGIQVFGSISSAFPSPGNPHFDPANPEECLQSVNNLLRGSDPSKELVLYWMEHFKDKCPCDWNPFNIYFAHLDFMLRFWKNDRYPTLPYLVALSK